MKTALDETDQQLFLRIGADRIAARERKVRRRNFWSALTFMAPAILLVGGLLLYPVVFNIYLSFTDWRRFKGLDTFIGFKNYERLFGQIYFAQASVREFISELGLPAAPPGADPRRRDLVLYLCPSRTAQLPAVVRYW